MNLDEALAVYLYLQSVPLDTRDEKAFNCAWGVICEYAQQTIGSGWCGQPAPTAGQE